MLTLCDMQVSSDASQLRSRSPIRTLPPPHHKHEHIHYNSSVPNLHTRPSEGRPTHRSMTPTPARSKLSVYNNEPHSPINPHPPLELQDRLEIYPPTAKSPHNRRRELPITSAPLPVSPTGHYETIDEVKSQQTVYDEGKGQRPMNPYVSDPSTQVSAQRRPNPPDYESARRAALSNQYNASLSALNNSYTDQSDNSKPVITQSGSGTLHRKKKSSSSSVTPGHVNGTLPFSHYNRNHQFTATEQPSHQSASTDQHISQSLVSNQHNSHLDSRMINSFSQSSASSQPLPQVRCV